MHLHLGLRIKKLLAETAGGWGGGTRSSCLAPPQLLFEAAEFLYVLGLFYCFLGVAVVSDVFMNAIERTGLCT